MIDLHIHTKYSDGTDDVPELLAKAEAAGIECLSITDHDDCRAYEVLAKINAKDYYTGRIIPGCEFTTTIEGITIELLGYKVDTSLLSRRIPECYMPRTERRKIAYQRLLKVCRKLGIVVDEENIVFVPETDHATVVIHDELVKHPENRKFFSNEEAWEGNPVFYRACVCNPRDIFYVDNSDNQPSVEEVIGLIKEAGGLVFIPHVYAYGENSERLFEILIRDYPIDGIECCYKMYSDEQTRFLMDFCKKNNLYMSGGSDYHGDAAPDVFLGTGKGNLNIPFELIADWVDK